jgi:hypothetical protein
MHAMPEVTALYTRSLLPSLSSAPKPACTGPVSVEEVRMSPKYIMADELPGIVFGFSEISTFSRFRQLCHAGLAFLAFQRMQAVQAPPCTVSMSREYLTNDDQHVLVSPEPFQPSQIRLVI